MTNNIIKFGDQYAKQISGTAMGKPPAPCWANLFQGLHEKEYLPLWKLFLPFYKRFIDDVFLLWRPPLTLSKTEKDTAWTNFKAEVNRHGLTWEFSQLTTTATFLDMNLTINNGKIETTLYEKPMALHLFIPPHSAHPPGVLRSHIYGNILRIFRLNSNQRDVTSDTITFLRRFVRRGHNINNLKPIFQSAIKNARKFLATSKEVRLAKALGKQEAASRRLYLHLEYHPQNPTSQQIQQLFHDIMLHPPGKKWLNELTCASEKVPIDAMIIAYHRARNLGDIFSYRDISKDKVPPV